MPSIFVNAGCIAVHDECEFIYGQGSGYVKRRKCVFQITWNFKIGTVGRSFLFCSNFLYGDDRETICANGEIPGNPLKSLKKLLGRVKTRHRQVTCNIQLL